MRCLTFLLLIVYLRGYWQLNWTISEEFRQCTSIFYCEIVLLDLTTIANYSSPMENATDNPSSKFQEERLINITDSLGEKNKTCKNDDNDSKGLGKILHHRISFQIIIPSNQ